MQYMQVSVRTQDSRAYLEAANPFAPNIDRLAA